MVVLSPPARVGRRRVAAAAAAGHVRVPAQVVGGLRRGARPDRGGKRQLPGEPVRRTRGAGLHPRGQEHLRIPRREQRLPRLAGQGAEVHLAVLPLRAAGRPTHFGRCARCRLGVRPQRRGHGRHRDLRSCCCSTCSSRRSSRSRRCSTRGSRPRRRWRRSTSSCTPPRPRPNRSRPSTPGACAARSRSRACTSSTRRRSTKRSPAPTSTSPRARPSRSSARRARASRPSSSSLPATTTRPPASCASTATTSATSTAPAFRRQLGVVPQEAFLFTGTVRDNIAYGRPDATDAEVEDAARAVGAHDFIARMPHGLPVARQRTRPQPLGRAASAHLARPRPTRRPGDPVARRSHVEPRPANRGRSAARDGCRRPRSHDDPRRPPPADGAHGRPHLRDRRGPHRRRRAPHDELLHTSPRYAELWHSFTTEDDTEAA